MAARATATKPQVTVDTLVDEQDTTTACGFPVVSSVTGTIRTTIFFDNADNFVRDLIHVQLHGIFTNPATGATVPFNVAERSSLAVASDDTATLTINGLTGKATIPGSGRVAADVGRLVLFFEGPDDVDPDVIFEAGHHDNGPFPLICSALER